MCDFAANNSVLEEADFVASEQLYHFAWKDHAVGKVEVKLQVFFQTSTKGQILLGEPF